MAKRRVITWALGLWTVGCSPSGPSAAQGLRDAVDVAPAGAEPDGATERVGTAATPGSRLDPGPVLAAARPTSPVERRDVDSHATEDEPRLRAEPVQSVVQEVFFGDRDRRVVALTFDDGPSRENTPRILDVLEREDVRATFFVLGERAAKMSDLVVAIAEGGHEIGNHTWSHKSMRSMWASQIRDELTRTNDVVHDAIGHRPALFRPPFGRYAPSALALIGELGMNVVLWSVDGEDWDQDEAAIAAAVVRNTRPGDIVLLHDRTATTAQALAAIIRGLRERGFELVTVSELTGLPAYASPDAASFAD